MSCCIGWPRIPNSSLTVSDHAGYVQFEANLCDVLVIILRRYYNGSVIIFVVLFYCQVFQSAQESLLHIMSGFGVQKEPFFTEKLNESTSSLLKALKDPALPLMEMRVRGKKRLIADFM